MVWYDVVVQYHMYVGDIVHYGCRCTSLPIPKFAVLTFIWDSVQFTVRYVCSRYCTIRFHVGEVLCR